MSTVHQSGDFSRSNLIGKILIGLSVVTAVVAYPPPTTGLDPLFGVGSMFLPLFVSVVSLFLALIGGTVLAQGLTQPQSKRTYRLLVHTAIPIGVMAIIGAYLVTVAGFEAPSSFIIGVVLVAIIGGVITKIID